MWAKAIWIGLFGAAAASAGTASAVQYCPAIGEHHEMSIDVVRLIAKDSGRETYSAQLLRFGGIGYIRLIFDVSDGEMASLHQLRLGISDRSLAPHSDGRPQLFAMLRVQGAQPWRAKIERDLEKGHSLDEFTIEAREYPQLASALENATSVELSVVDGDGVAVLTQRFSLPSPEDWRMLRDNVHKTMALVQAKTCDVSSAVVGPDLKPEGPPPLIIHGPPITSVSH